MSDNSPVDEQVEHFVVSKFASIALDLFISAVMLATYLIVGLILFLTATINLGSFLLFFVGISVVTALICAIMLLRQEKTEYFIYKNSRIKIYSHNRVYILPFWGIKEIKLKHCLTDKSNGTIKFIPQKAHRRFGVRFCFKNLPNIDKIYESLNRSYLYCNNSSLTISEWLDLSFEEFNDDAAAFCFVVLRRENNQFNYITYPDYITTDYREIAEDIGDDSPEINGWEDWFSLTEYEFYSCTLNMFNHPFKAKNDDEAFEFIKEELLKYIENGQYADYLKNCKAIVISCKGKFKKIY